MSPQNGVHKSEDGASSQLYVGGLHQHTTEHKLQSYFERLYGNVQQCVIKRAEDGVSRGYGFLVFREVSSLEAVLNDKKKATNIFSVDGCNLRVAKALPKASGLSRSEDTPRSAAELCGTRRVFISGLPRQPGCLTEVDIRSYFQKFGHVADVCIKEQRGFGFVTFEDGGAVARCLKESVHEICFHMCKVERAKGTRGQRRRRRGRDEEDANRPAGIRNDRVTKRSKGGDNYNSSSISYNNSTDRFNYSNRYSSTDRNGTGKENQGYHRAEDLETRVPNRSEHSPLFSSPSANHSAPVISASALSELALMLQASGNILSSYANRQNRLEHRTQDLLASLTCPPQNVERRNLVERNDAQYASSDRREDFLACLSAPYGTHEVSSYGPVRTAYSTIRRDKRHSRPYLPR